MIEARYRILDLSTKDSTAVDAMQLEEKIRGNFSAEEAVLFLDLIDEVDTEAEEVEGAQKGFVVYQKDHPVAYLGIHTPFTSGNILIQTLGGLVTDPDYRSIVLLQRMMDHVRDTQDEQIIYCYAADALLETSYKGIQYKGVQKWLGENGYALLDKHDIKDNQSARVFFYPKIWKTFFATMSPEGTEEALSSI